MCAAIHLIVVAVVKLKIVFLRGSQSYPTDVVCDDARNHKRPLCLAPAAPKMVDLYLVEKGSDESA